MKSDLLLIISLLLALSSLSAGCQVHLGAKPESTTITRSDSEYEIDREVMSFIYSEPEWPQALRADLYLPQRSGPLPVVMVIHGGGWANRSRRDMTSISRALAERGYAVMNLDYRFAPRYTYPAQLDDLQQARNWLAANAVRYQLDLDRVNAWGYSSGAHLAALLGSLEQSPDMDQEQKMARLRAVVAGGIPADLRKYRNSPMVMRFMGGALDDMPERYAQASPLYHVSADDPPVFLYHGKLDTLVSEDQSIDYYDALMAAGVETELHLYHLHGHMSMFLFGGDAEDRAMDFLDRNNAESMTLAGD